jgi:acetyltransferase-like isoleucine patch superfamily enzyme
MIIHRLCEKFFFHLKHFRWYRTTLGPHSFIELSVKISNPANISLGQNSYISHGVIITNDNGILKMGDQCHIASGCVINCAKGNLICGNNVAIGPNTCLICHSNYYSPKTLITETHISKNIIINENVFIGANATILPGITIGKNSIVGAGAVVTRDVPPNTIVGGVPAEKIKDRP